MFSRIKKSISEYKNKKNIIRLNVIGDDVDAYIKKSKPKINMKIIMGPSFSGFKPCFIHDRLLSYALKMRGVDVLPVYCDGIQENECNVRGGVWKIGDFKDDCQKCVRASETLWRKKHDHPRKLSEYVTSDDYLRSIQITANLDKEEWVEFCENGIEYGRYARDILVNNYVVGDYKLISGFHELGVSHIRNLLVLSNSYKRILIEQRPDRVISNDSFYGMWAVLQKNCESMRIPYYSHWMGTKSGTWCYAYNDAAMNLDFHKPWKNFSSMSLSDENRKKVKKWLNERSKGKGIVLDTASLGEYKDELFDFGGLDKSKPIALLAANVIWDLAALNKEVMYNSMFEWIVDTIEWFRRHNEYQLLIKPHPAELHPAIPKTEETVEYALKSSGTEIPENVFLLSPRSRVTVYDLLPHVKACLVYTTTVGIEAAAYGIPVVTCGMSPYRGYGITLDPESKYEYYKSIESMLSVNMLKQNNERIDLALKFILFYQFHYYMKIGFMDYNWGGVPVIKIKSYEELLPGNNKYIDYVVESIIEGSPILGENKWPPES